MKSALLMGYSIIVTFLLSCNAKVQETEFNKIEIGMTRKEVIQILGNPDKIQPMLNNDTCFFYYIQDDILNTEYATVQFDKSGHVSLKLYGNP